MFWIDHFGICVNDIDISSKFYGSLFETTPVDRVVWKGDNSVYLSKLLGVTKMEVEAVYFRLPYSNTLLELLEYRGLDNEVDNLSATSVGATHLGFFVDSVEESIKRLESIGFEDFSKPTDIPYGPYSGGKTVYFSDPDRVNLQMMDVRSRPGRLPVLLPGAPVPQYESAR